MVETPAPHLNIPSPNLVTDSDEDSHQSGQTPDAENAESEKANDVWHHVPISESQPVQEMAANQLAIPVLAPAAAPAATDSISARMLNKEIDESTVDDNHFSSHGKRKRRTTVRRLWP